MSAYLCAFFPPWALVDFLRLVVVGLEEIRDEIDGQWEDDRRVLLRRNGVQRLKDKRAHMLRSRFSYGQSILRLQIEHQTPKHGESYPYSFTY